MVYLLSNVVCDLRVVCHVPFNFNVYVPVVREYVCIYIAVRVLTCSGSRARMCNGCLLLTVYIQQPL